jgi:hypothetical protein
MPSAVAVASSASDESPGRDVFAEGGFAMIDRGTIALAELRLQHRHNDGTWGVLTPRPAHHAATDHDQERDWPRGTIYGCDCGEEVRIVPQDEAASPPD